MYKKVQPRRSSQDFLYDKYREPYEFPDLNLSSSDEEDEQMVRKGQYDDEHETVSDYNEENSEYAANENDSISDSVNLSRKIPIISDQQFKHTLELARNAARYKHNLDTSRPPSETKLNNAEKDENLIGSSTPNVTVDEKTRFGADSSEKDRIIHQQMAQINMLDSRIKEKDRYIEDFDSRIRLLTQENEKLRYSQKQMVEENSKYKQEINSANEERQVFNKNLSDANDKYNELFEQFNTLKKTAVKNSQESSTVVEEYERRIAQLENEKAQMLLNLEDERKTVAFFKKKFEATDTKLNEYRSKYEEMVSQIEDLNHELASINTVNLKSADKIKELLTQNNDLTYSNENLKAKINELNTGLKDLKDENLTIKTDFKTRLELLNSELKSVELHRNEIMDKYNDIKSKYELLIAEFDKKIGVSVIPISESNFPLKIYKELEMHLIDSLSLNECQNLIKNIVNSLNIKFSNLRNQILFIKETILKFFVEIHYLLHCSQNGNLMIIDRSKQVDFLDNENMIKCIKILINDIKVLKGIKQDF